MGQLNKLKELLKGIFRKVSANNVYTHLPSKQVWQKFTLFTDWGEILFFPKKCWGQSIIFGESRTQPTGKQFSVSW